MPIRFRCSSCNRLLGIATRKAGTQTRCPHCGAEISVPVPDDDSRTQRISLDDVEHLLGRGTTEGAAEPASATAAPPSAPSAGESRSEPPREPVPVPPRTPLPAPTPRVRPAPPQKAVATSPAPEERPLFEGDVDEILGSPAESGEPARPKPATSSGLDALSLGEPARHIVISAQLATLLMVVVVILMALAFAGGYFLSSKG